MKNKLQLTDSTPEVMLKMSEGNPGALTVCIQILKETDRIDPDNAMSGFGVLLSLDSLGIYASRIWMLFKDVCDSDIAAMLGVLRGWQLGFISEAQLNRAVDNRGLGLNVADICAKVVARPPRFQLTQPVQTKEPITT